MQNPDLLAAGRRQCIKSMASSTCRRPICILLYGTESLVIFSEGGDE